MAVPVGTCPHSVAERIFTHVFCRTQRLLGPAEGWECSTHAAATQNQLGFHQDSPPTMVSLRGGSLRQLLTIATGNPIKVAEIEAMLGPLEVEVQRQPDDLDVEEDE